MPQNYPDLEQNLRHWKFAFKKEVRSIFLNIKTSLKPSSKILVQLHTPVEWSVEFRKIIFNFIYNVKFINCFTSVSLSQSLHRFEVIRLNGCRYDCNNTETVFLPFNGQTTNSFYCGWNCMTLFDKMDVLM